MGNQTTVALRMKDQTRADQGRACHASVSPRTRGDVFIDSQAMKN